MITLKNITTQLVLLTILTTPFTSQAQDDKPSANGWGLGLGVAVRDTLYAGEDSRVQPFPLVNYEGERFYVKGPSLGYKFIHNEAFALSGFIAARFDGIEADDFGRSELAARGINRDLLEDRDMGADAGLSAVVRTADAGEFEFDLRADATDASDGYQASLNYRYPFQAGRVRLIPGVGVVALSAKLANYYYGILPKEVARGVVDYRPDSATIVRGSITEIVPSGQRWVWLATLSADAYPDEITESPLVMPQPISCPASFLAYSVISDADEFASDHKIQR